ncbi:TniQ family protein [Terasakiella pusilla]|uniref:TniQ family protein n=1 Tax=Terasakiella pusilla TaxID=64973 RepID=UPI000A016649|nr:TniQ family protein [Terasakiella pusilla]
MAITTSSHFQKVDFLPHEAFSSWFTRLASENSCSAKDFLHLLDDHFGYKGTLVRSSRDIDDPSEELLIALFCIDFANVEEMRSSTLSSWKNQITFPWLRTRYNSSTLSPVKKIRWCPTCLKENGNFDIRYRLGQNLCCSNHKQFISDKCPCCFQPITTWPLLNSKYALCPYCQSHLDKGNHLEVPDWALQWQELVDTANKKFVVFHTGKKVATFRFVEMFIMFHALLDPLYSPGKWVKGLAESPWIHPKYIYSLFDEFPNRVSSITTHMQTCALIIMLMNKDADKLKFFFAKLDETRQRIVAVVSDRCLPLNWSSYLPASAIEFAETDAMLKMRRPLYQSFTRYIRNPNPSKPIQPLRYPLSRKRNEILQ